MMKGILHTPFLYVAKAVALRLVKGTLRSPGIMWFLICLFICRSRLAKTTKTLFSMRISEAVLSC